MFWQSRPGDADNNIFLLDSDGALAYRNLFEIADNCSRHSVAESWL